MSIQNIRPIKLSNHFFYYIHLQHHWFVVLSSVVENNCLVKIISISSYERNSCTTWDLRSKKWFHADDHLWYPVTHGTKLNSSTSSHTMRVCLKYLRFRLCLGLSVISRMTIRSILEKNANIYLLPKLTELQFGAPQICQIAICLITLKLKCKGKLSYSECTLLYVLQITQL